MASRSADNEIKGLTPRINNHNHNSTTNSHSQHDQGSTVALVMWRAFTYLFGLFNYTLYFFVALKNGAFFEKTSEKENNDLILARDRFWNLSKQPVPGFHHEFFKTRDGRQLHYICNQQQSLAGRDLFIFIHGWPNTCTIWRNLFQEPSLPTSNATLIAVDLPGCGGSDSLPKYDAQVLECLTEFVAAMREKYGTEGDSVGSTFIVGHDWGCVVSMRLAAEAPCLADRFILFNGPLPDLLKSNAARSLNSSKLIFRQFQISPRKNIGCLFKAFQTLKPLLRQMMSSGYIFAFQLPSPLVKLLGQGGNQIFLRTCHKNEHPASPKEYNRSESMGANIGPSYEECKTETEGGARYSTSVMQRAHSIGDMFWHSTGYYRDGLAFDPWEKSIESIATLYNLDSDLSSSASPARRRSSSAGTSLFNEPARGTLRAPATVLWGEGDPFLHKAMCLDGIDNYLAKESEVILFPDLMHWLQIEKNARRTLAEIIALFANANGNSKQTTSYIADKVKKLDARATLMAKR